MSNQKYIRNDFNSIVSHLVEECGEVLAAAGKTLRWGAYSVNPELPRSKQETNIAWLEREIADLESVISRFKKWRQEEIERDVTP